MKKRALREVEVVIDVYCDVCATSCTKKDSGKAHTEFASLTADWGYASSHDGERYDIDLCESCFFNFLASLREARRKCEITLSEIDPLTNNDSNL